MRNRIKVLMAAGMFLISLSCSSRQFLVRPVPEVARFNRIAVFPLENLSGEPEAGSRVTALLVSELYNSNLVNLVEPGEVHQFILRERIRVAAQLDLDTIREASRQLNADAILFGTVGEYAFITIDIGRLPAVSISLRLVDANTGEIVWAAAHSLQGDFKEKLFGVGRVHSLGNLSEIAVDDLVQALGVAMYPEGKGIYEEKVSRKVKKELLPAKEAGEPVIPLAPPAAVTGASDAEKEKAHSAVLQEWKNIKGVSQ